MPNKARRIDKSVKPSSHQARFCFNSIWESFCFEQSLQKRKRRKAHVSRPAQECKVSLKSDEFVICFPKQAIFKLIPKDEVARLPADENTAEKRADKLWKYFDKGENGKKPPKSRQVRKWTDESWTVFVRADDTMCWFLSAESPSISHPYLFLFLPQSELLKVSLSRECWTMTRPCV